MFQFLLNFVCFKLLIETMGVYFQVIARTGNSECFIEITGYLLKMFNLDKYVVLYAREKNY